MSFVVAVLLATFGHLAVVAADPPAASTASRSSPNVLVILTDDLRWDALSCAGHPWFKTPHLDRLAAEGARFTNAFVTTSLCSPSRASLLSGLYAHRHRVLNNFTDFPNELLSYPRRLKEAGYQTAYIGKWHMGEQDDQQRPGFDHWMSHKGQGQYWDTEFNINGQRQVVKGYYTTVVTDAALDWIRRPHEKPWLLILGHKAPHGGPIVPEPKYEHAFDQAPVAKPKNFDSYRTADGKPAWLEAQFATWHGASGPLYNYRDYGKFVRAYFGTIASVDDSVGRIYDALHETGQLDRTLLIFTSDNGFALGEHGRVDKRTMYEESVRVPLLARYPPLIPKPQQITHMVLNLDLAPSILDICGAEPLPGIDGRSWKPLLAGQADGWRRSWLYEYNYEREFPYTPNVRGVRTDAWKYIRYPHGDGSQDRHKAELYNVQDLPLETRNLIDDPRAAEVASELRAELDRLLHDHPGSLQTLPLDEGIKNELPKF
jgi:N-acetylglucosamine-6-sulfatase